MTILEAWAHVRLRVLDGCIRARWRGSKRRTYLRRYEAVAFLDAELDFDADSLPSMWECRECGIFNRSAGTTLISTISSAVATVPARETMSILLGMIRIGSCPHAG